jgi:2,3-bisphosphoglycerate-independent phosphoglycerate mutase
MKAAEIAHEVVMALNQGTNVIIANIANPDMLGHTARVPAIKEGLRITDNALRQICEVAAVRGATVIITADHGNAECNFDVENNQPHTAHTTNPVPCIITAPVYVRKGTLADIAPTILELLSIEQPSCMTGRSLLASKI